MAKISARDVQAACEVILGRDAVHDMIRANTNLPGIIDCAVMMAFCEIEEVYRRSSSVVDAKQAVLILQLACRYLRHGMFLDGVARITNE